MVAGIQNRHLTDLAIHIRRHLIALGITTMASTASPANQANRERATTILRIHHPRPDLVVTTTAVEGEDILVEGGDLVVITVAAEIDLVAIIAVVEIDLVVTTAVEKIDQAVTVTLEMIDLVVTMTLEQIVATILKQTVATTSWEQTTKTTLKRIVVTTLEQVLIKNLIQADLVVTTIIKREWTDLVATTMILEEGDPVTPTHHHHTDQAIHIHHHHTVQATLIVMAARANLENHMVIIMVASLEKDMEVTAEGTAILVPVILVPVIPVLVIEATQVPL